MKKKNNKNILLWIVILVLVGSIAIYINAKNSNQESFLNIATKEQTKTFQSKNLKFKIDIPSGFQVTEKFTTVIIKKSPNEIVISRNGTNFDNIDNYLKDLELKNKFELSNAKKINIGTLSVINGFNKNEKEYFIFVEGWIYLISTSSESLYGDLDQIAQSFRYTP